MQNYAQRGRETWNEKNFSRVLDGATRMALVRALKWAPTWYVSAHFPTFISYQDLIQRLAIKGISGVSWDISSGAHFKALNEPVLMAPCKVLKKFFFHFDSLSRTVCMHYVALYLLRSIVLQLQTLSTAAPAWEQCEFVQNPQIIHCMCNWKTESDDRLPNKVFCEYLYISPLDGDAT